MSAPLSMSVTEWRRLIAACLERHDMEGVGHALRLMSIDKPSDALDMLGFLKTALSALK